MMTCYYYPNPCRCEAGSALIALTVIQSYLTTLFSTLETYLVLDYSVSVLWTKMALETGSVQVESR